VDATVTKWPEPCRWEGKRGGDAMQHPAQVDVDHLVPVIKLPGGEGSVERDAGVGHERV
jgi:hypothetical protein